MNTLLGAGESHRFVAAGRPYAYLVPSAAIFALDDAAAAVLDELESRPRTRDELLGDLSPRFDASMLDETLSELARVRAIRDIEARSTPGPKILPLTPFPLTTMVLNVTNQCNLACTYCYEYSEDKIVDTANGKKPKFMSEETARESVDFMLREAGDNPVAYLTFFGGETLLNFPVLQKTIAYARQRASEMGKDVEFSLTTNATLLKPDVITFLAENHVSVTISIDGPQDVQDKFRVFHNGEGSYDVVAPKIRELLQRHHTRPIGARVTLAGGVTDVKRIFRHLTEEIGFREVGFAPATTGTDRSYTIPESGMDAVLGQFSDLAFEFLEAAVENRHHGFSNVKDTLEEIHKGVSKAFPCGAGLGLLGVATDGDVNLCHRFSGSDAHNFGHVSTGIDRGAQAAFLERHHIDEKTDCHTCWARPLCSGGCYHEAHIRHGNTTRPNLHFCEWIRGWTDICLRVYGELAERNPEYLARFDREQMAERVS